MFRIRSLGTKISLYAGSLILLFCIGLSFLAYNSGSSAVIAEVEQALTLQAQEAARYIDSRIELHLSVLETIAERPEMKSMIWGLQKSIVETEAERLDEYLAIGVVDRNGSARYSDGSTAELGDREHVQRALAGESVVSNILTARVGDSLVLMYAVPIRDDAGQVVGSLIGRSDGTVLSEITSNLGFGENGWAYIFNNDGTLYADQDLQRVIEQRNLLTDRGELADLGRAVKELGIGETGVIRFQEGGIKKMSGLAPIPSTDWIVGVGALEADVLGNVNTLRTFLILISLVFVALGIVMAIGIARQIANPLREVQRVIEAVARGDLTQSAQVKAQDEVGRVAAALNETIKRVRDVVEQLAATTGRLSATSQAMAAASEEVSASIEEVASTTNEFSGNLDEISGNAQTMNTNVREIATKAATGEGAILEIVEQIRSIHTTTQTLAETISQLGGLSDQIGNIVNVIGDIADQTNLLALNAAIEAARAGEHGRGFAVVAEEVRDLAEKSAEATTEVTSLIAQIQTQVSEAVVEMNSGAKEAEVAVDNVGASGKLLGDILAEIEDIVGVVERITRGLEQTNLAGHEIASATEEQAASIEQVASSAQDLSLLGTRLTKLVEHFRLEV